MWLRKAVGQAPVSRNSYTGNFGKWAPWPLSQRGAARVSVMAGTGCMRCTRVHVQVGAWYMGAYGCMVHGYMGAFWDMFLDPFPEPVLGPGRERPGQTKTRKHAEMTPRNTCRNDTKLTSFPCPICRYHSAIRHQSGKTVSDMSNLWNKEHLAKIWLKYD